MNILIKHLIQRPNIFYFKAFGMMNLHYGVRICQKIYNRVTMTVYVKCVVRFNVHKTLGTLPLMKHLWFPMDANPARTKNLERSLINEGLNWLKVPDHRCPWIYGQYSNRRIYLKNMPCHQKKKTFGRSQYNQTNDQFYQQKKYQIFRLNFQKLHNRAEPLCLLNLGEHSPVPRRIKRGVSDSP